MKSKREAVLELLLKETVGFLAIAIALNPNSGGKINANELLMQIQSEVGLSVRSALTEGEQKTLKDDMGW